MKRNNYKKFGMPFIFVIYLILAGSCAMNTALTESSESLGDGTIEISTEYYQGMNMKSTIYLENTGLDHFVYSGLDYQFGHAWNIGLGLTDNLDFKVKFGESLNLNGNFPYYIKPFIKYKLPFKSERFSMAILLGYYIEGKKDYSLTNDYEFDTYVEDYYFSVRSWDIPIIFGYKKSDNLSFYTAFRYSRDNVNLQYIEDEYWVEFEKKEVDYTLDRFGVIFGASFEKQITFKKLGWNFKIEDKKRDVVITPEIGLLMTDQINTGLCVIPIYAFKIGFLSNKKKHEKKSN